MLSGTTIIATGECLGIKVVFHDKRVPQFCFGLTYRDAIGERRTLQILMSEMAFEMNYAEI
jgi:hypothetical protein